MKIERQDFSDTAFAIANPRKIIVQGLVRVLEIRTAMSTPRFHRDGEPIHLLYLQRDENDPTRFEVVLYAEDTDRTLGPHLQDLQYLGSIGTPERDKVVFVKVTRLEPTSASSATP